MIPIKDKYSIVYLLIIIFTRIIIEKNAHTMFQFIIW